MPRLMGSGQRHPGSWRRRGDWGTLKAVNRLTRWTTRARLRRVEEVGAAAVHLDASWPHRSTSRRCRRCNATLDDCHVHAETPAAPQAGERQAKKPGTIVTSRSTPLSLHGSHDNGSGPHCGCADVIDEAGGGLARTARLRSLILVPICCYEGRPDRGAHRRRRGRGRSAPGPPIIWARQRRKRDVFFDVTTEDGGAIIGDYKPVYDIISWTSR